MSTRLTSTKLGSGGADSGRSRPGQAGRRPGTSQSRSVSRADSVAIRSMVRAQVLVVVERRQRGDLGGGGDGPGLLAPPEPVDHVGRGHRVADPEAGEGVDLGHRPQDEQVVAVDGGADRAVRSASSGRNGEVGLVDDRQQRRAMRSIRSSRRSRSQARPVGLLGWPVQKIPVAPLGEDVLVPAQDVVVPDLGPQAVLGRGPAVLAVGRLDQVGQRAARGRPARGRAGPGARGAPGRSG